MNANTKIFAPLVLAITLVIGIYMGVFLSANTDSQQVSYIIPPSKTSAGKLNQILNFIEKQYVDTVQKERLVERAISSILSELDPHSYYISPEELMAFNEPLEGNFDGIGVEFLIQKDTIVVVNTIIGGPSESVGIMPGDRIITVDGKKVAGVGIESDHVLQTLRGQKGSKVRLEVQRKHAGRLLSFTITRGQIPINSIDAALKLNDSTAFIKITRFAKTTHQDFQKAVKDLERSGKFSRLILDLRGNGGGLLSSAIEICEELLPKGKMIVFTKGKSQPVRKYYSTRDGSLRNVRIDVLINESSASASEILAGAIQDNDRGTIIGRRSFGKGLVQEVMGLPDRSALSLTVARYYTPTGRSIQKPYGEGIDYENEFEQRFQQGELVYRDSVKVVDSLKYRTPKGKIVYGGGGIIPDIFVPADTSELSLLVSSLVYTGVINEFAFDYVDKHREMLKRYGSAASFNEKFQMDDKTVKNLMEQALDTGSRVKRIISSAESRAIKLRLKALIARNIWGNHGYYQVILPNDQTVITALK